MGQCPSGLIGVHHVTPLTPGASLYSLTQEDDHATATYNVGNMFERARAMDLATWAEGKPIFEDYQRLNTLIQESVDAPVIKDELLTILKRQAGLISQPESRSLILRAICGELVKQPRNTPAEIVANGRSRQGRGSER